MLKYLFLCLFMGLSAYALQSFADCQITTVDEWAQVKKIIDGDTAILSDGRKVRFIGINTAEIGRAGRISEPFAWQALLELQSLINHDSKIGLTYGQQKKDKYQRLLAHLTLPDGRNAASVLLQKGLAVSIVVPPNDRFLSCYRKVEDQARAKQLGIWQLPENQLFAAEELSSKAKGYRFVRGTIEKYKSSKKSFYLQLNSQLDIRISKQDLNNFKHIELKKLKGSEIIVRGWVNSYNGRQSIHITHEDNISIVSKP